MEKNKFKVRITSVPKTKMYEGGGTNDGEGPKYDPVTKTYKVSDVKGSPFNESETFTDKGKKYWQGVLADLQSGEFKDLFKDVKFPEKWDKKQANTLVETLQNKYKGKSFEPLVLDYMKRVDETNQKNLNPNSEASGFYDTLAFFRMPNVRQGTKEEMAALKSQTPVEVNGKKVYFNQFKNYGTGDSKSSGLGEYVYFDEKGEVKTVSPEEQKQIETTPELQYKFVNNNINNPYQRKQLPFYQIAPDLANFAVANDMYNYWTPDYTRQEIQAPTLNIQDQLNSIDASLDAVNRTTTGNPLLDQARKQSAFSQILQAKDTAYARKQNYDAEGRFKADSFNIDARNTEMINDINAASKIYNDYMAEAKDNMTYEKMASIQNMYRKYGLNEATENRYEILSKMFPQMKWNSKTGSGEFQSNPADFNFLNIENTIPQNTQPKTITNKINTLNPNIKELDNSYNLIDQSLNNIGLFPEDGDLINKYGR